MHTKAVFRAAQALSDVKIAALRFNFRGVGTSTGSFDQGIGEKDDVLASLDWLEERHPGLPLVVGGFSFGSMVALSAGGGRSPGRRALWPGASHSDVRLRISCGCKEACPCGSG